LEMAIRLLSFVSSCDWMGGRDSEMKRQSKVKWGLGVVLGW